MRRSGSVAGPLILIAVGIVFLLHTISPELRIFEIFIRYWPYFLIAWGVFQLLEIAVSASRGTPVPYRGLSGGSWILVVLICIIGFTGFEVAHPRWWWSRVGFDGVQILGNEHAFSFAPVEKAAGLTPHIVIERFRGDAKITGVDDSKVTVSGHKSIHALHESDAERVNRQTPVDVIIQGETVIVRCNQDRARGRESVTTDLDLLVPKGSTIEATGTAGDFDISSIKGDLDLSSDNSGVRIQDVQGSIRVNTGRSDQIRCANVGGSINLHGRGTDLELSKVQGEVTVTGDYNGVVTLEQISKPVRIESMRTTLNIKSVPGQVKLARGSLDGHDLSGPMKVAARATDVTLENFTNDLDLSVDKGDIELTPATSSMGQISVRTGSGDIEFVMPQAAHFALTAATDHGSIDSDLGPTFAPQEQGMGALLQAKAGNGPEVNLTTTHGNINVRRGGHIRINPHETPKPTRHSASDEMAEVFSTTLR